MSSFIVNVTENVINVTVEASETSVITVIQQGPPGTPGVGSGGAGIPPGGTLRQVLKKYSSNDFDTFWEDIPVSTGSPNRTAIFNQTGELSALDFQVISHLNMPIQGISVEPNNQSGNWPFVKSVLNLEPSIDSPDESWTMFQNFINFDANSSNFGIGSNSNAFYFDSNNFWEKGGNGDIGTLDFISNYFEVGNVVDPVNFR
jgi:hypothetical protein